MTPVALDAATCWQITLALWHTTWIGLVVGILAAAGNWLLRRGSAQQRYVLNFGALLVVGVCLPVTFAVIRWKELGVGVAPVAVSVPAARLESAAPDATRSDPESPEMVVTPSGPAVGAPAFPAVIPPEKVETRAVTLSAVQSAEPSAAQRVRDQIRAAAPLITTLYLLGVAAMLVKLIAAIYGGQRLRAAGRPVADPRVLDILARQSRRLALRFVPVVAYCERVAVPVVIGVIRPMILAPAVMVSGLTPDELVAVLTHELAHIRRYDHLLILVQRFVESLLFFHPAVWYLSRRVQQERETCCDDLVVTANGDRLAYARSLLRVAELRLAGDARRTQLAALAADGQRPSQLRQRIARLLGDPVETNIRFRNRWPATLLGLACAAAIWAGSAATWQVVAAINRDDPQSEIDNLAAAALDPPLDPSAADDAPSSTDAEAFASRMVAAMRRQKLPFIGEEQIAELQAEVQGFLGERLKQPLPAARREELVRGIDQYVDRYFRHDPGWESTYLEFRDRLDTLKWELWIAGVRPDLTAEQRARRDEQRRWLRDHVLGLPAPRGLKHKERLDELERMWGDPLNPFDYEPLPEDLWTEFRAISKARGDAQSLLFVHTDLYDVMVRSRIDGFLKKWPMRTVGWSRGNMDFQLSVTPVVGNGTLDLPDFNTSASSVYLDVMGMVFVAAVAPRELAARAEWLDVQGQGDLCYDGQQDAFVGVRGAKIALLDATSWQAADRVKLAELRRLIREKGGSTVPLPEFAMVREQAGAGMREVKPNAPSLVVQTKEGGICVIRVYSFGGGTNPYVRRGLRPLAPNPPLHSGDENPAPDADSKNEQTQAVENWLKNLAGESAPLRAQAAAEIRQQRIDEPLEALDPRLIKALARLLDNEEMATHGPLTQRVGDWCKEALKAIGKAAAPELIRVATQGSAKARGRAAECLGEIKSLGPSGVEALIGLLGQADYEARGPASSALARISEEPTLIPKLIEATASASLQARGAAIGVLGNFQDERVDPVLINALDDEERDIQLWAIHAARQKPRPQLAAEYVVRLKTDDQEIRNLLEIALFFVAKNAVEPVFAGLKDPDPHVRAGCLSAARETLPATATRLGPLVTRALSDEDTVVRQRALALVAYAAWQFDREPLVVPLLKSLADPDVAIRTEAAAALQKFAEAWPTDRRPVDPLLKALDDAEPAVVAGAVRALAAYREPKAIASLVRLAEAGGEAGRAASEALGTLRVQRGRDVLRQNLANKRPADIEALGKLHDRESIPQFIELLKDPNDDVRAAAAKALALNPDPRAMEPLIAGLKEGFGGFRPGLRGDRNNATLAIADALGRSGDRRGIVAMISAIDDAVVPWHRPFADNWEPEYPFTLDMPLGTHPFAAPLSRAGLPALPELAKGLSSPSARTRGVCAWALEQLAVPGELEPADFDAIYPALLAGVRDDDVAVRFCLVKTIGLLKRPETEAVLLELLESPVPEGPGGEASAVAPLPRNSLPAATQIRVEAIRGLFAFKSERVRDALLRALKHADAAVRAAAAGHLGSFPADVTVEPLINALSDPGASAEAARVLGHVGDLRAVQPLMETLRSNPNPVVQANAAQSLGLLGAADAREALRDALQQIPAEKNKSERFDVQLAAAVSLVQLQDEAGTARLKEVLESPDRGSRQAAATRLSLAAYFSEWRPPARLSHEPTRALMRHFAEHAPDTETRLYLIEALGRDLDETTRAFLERRASDPDEPLRWTARRTLARPNPAAYETQLLKLLDENDDRTRRDIVFFLAQIPSQRITERLLALTSTPDDELRAAVTAGLAKHRSAAVDARLRDLAANDPSSQVRTCAAKALAAASAPGK